VFPLTLYRIHQEVGLDARVRLRDPVARPPPAEPDARLRLRAPLAAPPRPGEPDAARVRLRSGAPRPQPATRQAGPPRRGAVAGCGEEGGREGERPRSVSSGAVVSKEGGGR
jgi:hypothetical protein